MPVVLRGTDPLFRDGSTGQWNDQRNLLGQMHPLEKMVLERSLHYFFDPDYSSLAYDDEMLGSKAEEALHNNQRHLRAFFYQ